MIQIREKSCHYVHVFRYLILNKDLYTYLSLHKFTKQEEEGKYSFVQRGGTCLNQKSKQYMTMFIYV